VIARGIVAANPKLIPRRHVIFPIKDDDACVDCAAYEPTGILRKAAVKLVEGDCVEVYGGVRAPSRNCPLTINLEKLLVLRLMPKMVYRNPLCPKCGKRLKSMGKAKGFKCEKCGLRFSDLSKVGVKVKRELAKGLYVTSPRSQRHLTKPIERYGMEKRGLIAKEFIDGWHYP
jgi:tRNA(Ile2)-agmatinylcytidine synthase